jgi:hypothetical protein
MHCAGEPAASTKPPNKSSISNQLAPKNMHACAGGQQKEEFIFAYSREKFLFAYSREKFLFAYSREEFQFAYSRE